MSKILRQSVTTFVWKAHPLIDEHEQLFKILIEIIKNVLLPHNINNVYFPHLIPILSSELLDKLPQVILTVNNGGFFRRKITDLLQQREMSENVGPG